MRSSVSPPRPSSPTTHRSSRRRSGRRRPTGLFIGGFGAYGYATRRDLSKIARVAFFALLGLIGFGIVLMFVSIPGGDVIYAVLGLVIFAGYTMYDFQRLRRADQIQAAPLLAASIFLDVFNVFLLLLSLFGGGRS